MLNIARTPRYQEIEEYLRQLIATLRPGDPLPSDKDLCASFGVSRMTARQAVSVLVEAGLIRRETGKGTFVARPPLRREVGTLLSFTRQMERQGRSASSRLLALTSEPASGDVAARLGLDLGDPVLRIHRLRLADGLPMANEILQLCERQFGWLAEADLEGGSLHRALEARGIVPSAGEGTLTSESATREDAHLLGLPVGAPVMVERLLLVDQAGAPIQIGETRYAGNRYALDFHLHRETLS